jgi:hypothetical protein
MLPRFAFERTALFRSAQSLNAPRPIAVTDHGSPMISKPELRKA